MSCYLQGTHSVSSPRNFKSRGFVEDTSSREYLVAITYSCSSMNGNAILEHIITTDYGVLVDVTERTDNVIVT